MVRYTILVLLLCICYSASISIPSEFPKCMRNDPHLNDCLMKATELVKPRLQKGVRELGIPPINPFVLPAISLQQETGIIKYKVDLKNVIIHGLENYKFRELDYDPENYVVTAIIAFEKIFLRANFDFTGSALSSPLKGMGDFKGTTGISIATIVANGKPEELNGKTYIKPKSVEVKLNISNAGGHYKGLINDNEELAVFTSKILNDNAQELFTSACPQIQLAVGEIVTEFWENTLGLVPYEEILPLSV